MILVIDDKRVMDFECVYARTLHEATALLRRQDWDEVWWDHDMGADERGNPITVRPLVILLEKYAFLGLRDRPKIKRCIVHTSNPAGGHWIAAGLRNAGYSVTRTYWPPVMTSEV